ncbi:MAG: glycosyltransferase family 4 protein [Ferroplasma sp.]|uniref:glycosyltransferase family 4 protein n=1 Tax=Ferroplasma sp. TaxID=2591003 RepID=UPI002814B31C|nr:glycosyltransferase family 4 protein [Ferroplasma sp.]WMT50600.1 MAG: glycosyltransferase family 4 protein [Ferroplasma sp.]
MRVDLRTGRGTENVLFNLLKYVPQDVDITIIEPDNLKQERIPEEEVKKLTAGCHIIKIHKHVYRMDSIIQRVYVNSILRPPYRDLKYAESRGLLSEIKKTDIVYLFQNEYSIFFKGMNIPVIGSGHAFTIGDFVNREDLPHKIYANYLYRTYFKNINGFNYFPKDSEVFSKLNDKWHLKYNFPLPPGVNTELFYPDSHIPGKKLKILFVAALEYSKGLDLLIPLMEKFGESDEIEFHIAGRGPLEEELSKMKYVKYHGRLDNEELAKLYRECDVFVYPSHNDTYSLVTLQALSSGMYVLAGDFFKGIFDDLSKYLEYLPMNIDAFYNRINYIIKDRKIIEHNKQDEYQYVKRNYDWSIIAKRFYDNMNNIYNEFSNEKN